MTIVVTEDILTEGAFGDSWRPRLPLSPLANETICRHWKPDSNAANIQLPTE